MKLRLPGDLRKFLNFQIARNPGAATTDDFMLLEIAVLTKNGNLGDLSSTPLCVIHTSRGHVWATATGTLA